MPNMIFPYQNRSKNGKNSLLSLIYNFSLNSKVDNTIFDRYFCRHNLSLSIDLGQCLISIFVGISQRVNAPLAPMKREDSRFQEIEHQKGNVTFGLEWQIMPQLLIITSRTSKFGNRGEKIIGYGMVFFL